MPQKLTIIGDPHRRLDNQDRVDAVCKVVEALGNPCIWLGDMLDTKDVIRGACLNAWLDYFKASHLWHYVLVGNHDLLNLHTKDHALRVLGELPNVVIVDELKRFDAWGDSHEIWMTPYVHEMSADYLKPVPNNATLFGHFELKDFDFGNGRICDSGMTFADFDRFKRVITGHFHKYQERGRVTYLGTPFSLNFGETDQTKYLGVYDLETNVLDLLETQFPRHRTYEIDCDAGNANLWKNIPLTRDEDFNRWVLTGTQANINLFDRGKLPPDAKISTKPTDLGNIAVEIEEVTSNPEKFEQWAKDIKHLDPDTIKLGRNILEQCNVG